MTEVKDDETQKIWNERKVSTNVVCDDDLEIALEEIGRPSCWLWGVFLIASSPGILNIWHDTGYVFIGGVLPHWCDVQELHGTNWTEDQIRTIVTGDPTASSCSAMNWNYTQLANLSYEAALHLTKTIQFPGRYECDKFTYIGTGIMAQWDLVCSRAALRPLTQVMLYLGNILGSIVFGYVGDKWGRRNAFAWACLLFVVATFTASLTWSYTLFVFARIGTGMAATGTYNTAYTTLTEICSQEYRSLFGIFFNIFLAVGMLTLSGIAYACMDDWHTLMFAITAPTLLLVFVHAVFLPESPRWLLSRGKRKEAWEVVLEATKGRRCPKTVNEKTILVHKASITEHRPPVFNSVFQSLSSLVKLFSTADMTFRLLIGFSLRLVVWMTVTVISLNANNLELNTYIYICLAGLFSIFAYIFPYCVLKFIGRRVSCSLAFFITAAALLVTLLVPLDIHWLLYVPSMASKFCAALANPTVILYNSELFPVEVRSSAIGATTVGAYVGAMMAPLIVDLLGAKAWFIPSTLCGALCIVAGLLALLLPETRNKELCTTVKQAMEKEDRVSFRNCCACE